MSDERTRDLERRARQGDPDAARAASASACRAGQHAWSCCDLDGAWTNYIWCIHCLARRPQDEHERAVDAWLEHLNAQARATVARVDITPAAQNRECERLAEEGGRLLMVLRAYREAIAPCRMLRLNLAIDESGNL